MSTWLPTEKLQKVEAWGRSSASAAYVFRPVNIEGILEVFELARKSGVRVAIKGGGNSYGDVFQAREGIVIDLSRMTRVTEWDPGTGVIVCEPGITIDSLWRYTIEDGWWPPVVSGTSRVTLGGALSANIHGKNNFKEGPIGEHVLKFRLLAPKGDIFTCSPFENSEIFYAAIGGFGLLGVIVEIELQLKKLYSGLLRVEAVATPHWGATFRAFTERELQADYLVGWIDAFAGGSSAGRGLIHSAYYRGEGEDPHPEETLRVVDQKLPETMMRFLSRTGLPYIMRPFVNRTGMKLVNALKYRAALKESGKVSYQKIVPFNFLLDSIPNWKDAYLPGALIQYQVFVPKEKAHEVFDEVTKLSRERGLPPFLAVMKRHRPDSFLLSHGVDGYSLALDYPLNNKNRDWLWKLTHDMNHIVIPAGARFYFAKDATMNQDTVTRFLPQDSLKAFFEIKSKTDPEGILQSELMRRVFSGFSNPVISPAAENDAGSLL